MVVASLKKIVVSYPCVWLDFGYQSFYLKISIKDCKWEGCIIGGISCGLCLGWWNICCRKNFVLGLTSLKRINCTIGVNTKGRTYKFCGKPKDNGFSLRFSDESYRHIFSELKTISTRAKVEDENPKRNLIKRIQARFDSIGRPLLSLFTWEEEKITHN